MSMDLKDTRRAVGPLGIAGQFGVVSKSIVLVTDPLFYYLPDFDYGVEQWGPARWSPRVTLIDGDLHILLPQRGDECIVIDDNRHGHWVAEWWPVTP